MLAAISLKGGVGKTSVVLGLAASAWAAGHRTLVIDLDPQANATAALDPHPYGFTTNDVLADGREGIAADVRALEAPWRAHVDAVFAEATLAVPQGVYMQGVRRPGGKAGVHTEHLGHLLAEMQFLPRAYPNAQW